jgi:hypothetical protein
MSLKIKTLFISFTRCLQGFFETKDRRLKFNNLFFLNSWSFLDSSPFWVGSVKLEGSIKFVKFFISASVSQDIYPLNIKWNIDDSNAF